MRAACMLIAACLTAGCYSYAPLTTSTPEPGIELAVTLTDSGSVALARYLGPTVMVVRGRYLGSGEGGLRLSVSSVELKRGDELPWAGETVTVPTDAVASLEVRRFAKGRSYLLVGGSVAAFVAAVSAFALTGSGSASQTVGGPPGKQ